MSVSNLIGISFPFRRGPNSFPQGVTGARAVVEDTFSLMLISAGEMPMGSSLGVNIHNYVHETSGPLLAARVAQDIRTVIRVKEPRMRILAVNTEEKIVDGKNAMMTGIEYQVAGQDGRLQIPIGQSGPFTTG